MHSQDHAQFIGDRCAFLIGPNVCLQPAARYMLEIVHRLYKACADVQKKPECRGSSDSVQ